MHQRKLFLLPLLLGFAICWLSQHALAARPNVVVFLIDDLGYGDLGCYGSTFYETPRIDALAVESVRFTDFYSAHPVCSPTRAALMTGQAPQRLGITQWLSPPSEKHLPLDQVTMGEAFTEAGYRTGYIGKWHLGHRSKHLPVNQGFAWMRCVNRAGQPAGYFHPFAGRQRDGVAYWDVPDLAASQPNDYLTDKLTDQALEFLSHENQRPFFLCFAHYAVHTPIQSPQRLEEKYTEKRNSQFADSPSPSAEEGTAKTRIRQDHPGYAGMIENLDTNVGRVLDHLQQRGQRENTIIVFTSDNGGLSTLANKKTGPTSVRPLRAGKGWTYEGGIRVPTLIAWPGSIEPRVTSVPGITTDFYPTLLELCDVPVRPQQHRDGVSLVSVLRGDASPDAQLKNRTLGWHYPHNHGSGHRPSSALRMGRWKLVHRIEPPEYELYDLENDIGEQHNLAQEQPDVAHDMQTRLEAWLKQTLPTEANAS